MNCIFCRHATCFRSLENNLLSAQEKRIYNAKSDSSPFTVLDVVPVELLSLKGYEQVFKQGKKN